MIIRKKLLLGLSVLLCACAGSSGARAQNTYLRLGTGFAFKGATATFPEVTANSLKANNISLGKGINNQAGLGYMFSEHFGAELGLGYLVGLNSSLGQLPQYGGKAKARANQFQVAPALLVRGSGEKVAPYARFGFVAGFTKAIIESEGVIADTGFGEAKARAVFELTGSLATGFAAALGGTYALTDKLGFYAEANLTQMAWAPKKGKLTSLTSNGQSYLPFVPASEREIEFVDELPLNSQGGQTDNRPAKQLRTRLPLSNVGIGIGLVYTF